MSLVEEVLALADEVGLGGHSENRKRPGYCSDCYDLWPNGGHPWPCEYEKRARLLTRLATELQNAEKVVEAARRYEQDGTWVLELALAQYDEGMPQ